MAHVTRRDFLRTSLAGTLLAGTAGKAFPAAKKAATDWVTLGNSGVQVTRLAFGTGTLGGKVQRELGQEAFTRLVRHAYDRGIRFFETADAYTGMPQMLATADAALLIGDPALKADNSVVVWGTNNFGQCAVPAEASGSGTASASAFRFRIATFVSRSGGWMSAIKPHSNRERRRSSSAVISCGGRSLLSTICFCAS